jgi:hypothetical protein
MLRLDQDCAANLLHVYAIDPDRGTISFYACFSTTMPFERKRHNALNTLSDDDLGKPLTLFGVTYIIESAIVTTLTFAVPEMLRRRVDG